MKRFTHQFVIRNKYCHYKKCFECLECFFLPKPDMKSSDFVLTVFLMKLFRTVNHGVIGDCCKFLQFTLPSDQLAVRYEKKYHVVQTCSKLYWYFGINIS